MNEFHTITSVTEGIYKEKGSRFLAFAFPVSDEQQVKERVEGLKKQYYDARHHCYAYILGLKKQSFRANDDGEPNHSAGDPILGQIRSRNLTNCLVVVVRYFGGIKLGVGGLVTAYKAAAEDALEKAQVITIYSQTTFSLTFGYEVTAEVERALSEFDIVYLEKLYQADCQYRGLIKDEEVPLLQGKFKLTKGISLHFESDQT